MGTIWVYNFFFILKHYHENSVVIQVAWTENLLLIAKGIHLTKVFGNRTDIQPNNFPRSLGGDKYVGMDCTCS